MNLDRLVSKDKINEIAKLLYGDNALLSDLAKRYPLPPETPTTWLQRRKAWLGNRLISLGIRLGGDYDY